MFVKFHLSPLKDTINQSKNVCPVCLFPQKLSYDHDLYAQGEIRHDIDLQTA